MAEQEYFKRALSDFAFEAAVGGEIRHLTDLGYTVRQIEERLDFPAPGRKVRQAAWERLLDTGAVLLEEPGAGTARERVSYVKEYGKYGKPSFRKVGGGMGGREKACWAESLFSEERDGSLASVLSEKCGRNGEKDAYASWNFGLYGPERREGLLRLLEEHQREYVEGLPWEGKTVYHRLDGRMRGIVARLHAAGAYHGSCYFMKIGEKLTI